jgi:hypothetical protein
MQNRSSNKRPGDINQLAELIVEAFTIACKNFHLPAA